MAIDPAKNYRATIETNKGTIELDLFADQAPLSVNNFVFLANEGFFDGLTFHRVVPGFVIQGGDPTGTGRGGPGYRWQDEPVRGSYKAGSLAMANAGPDTNGSQFFICIEDQPGLPKNYNLFGQTTAGLDVVRNIQVGDRMTKVTISEQ